MKESRALIFTALIFGGIGAISVQFIALELLSKILPFVMIMLGAYFMLSSNISENGSFILAILVAVGGYGLSKALAHSRWVVFGINISSTFFFILSGNVLWLLGILMCQSIGATLGAKLAIKHGAKVIRPIVICICFGISIQQRNFSS